MTWGAFYMYYKCPKCGKKFKSELGVMEEMGKRFGQCPDCKIDSEFIKEGQKTKDDLDYEEVD